MLLSIVPELFGVNAATITASTVAVDTVAPFRVDMPTAIVLPELFV